jgi:hypothetical protein
VRGVYANSDVYLNGACHGLVAVIINHKKTMSFQISVLGELGKGSWVTLLLRTGLLIAHIISITMRYKHLVLLFISMLNSLSFGILFWILFQFMSELFLFIEWCIFWKLVVI